MKRHRTPSAEAAITIHITLDSVSMSIGTECKATRGTDEERKSCMKMQSVRGD